MAVYLGIVGSLSTSISAAGFDVNRFILRLAYLLLATWMLVYLGRYEERLRSEIERIARWPAPLAGDGERAIGRVLEYAAGLMHAGRVLVFWEAADEPALHEAQWDGGLTLHRHRPGAIALLTDDQASQSTFICDGAIRDAQAILVLDESGRLIRRLGLPLSEAVIDRLGSTGLATAPLKTEAVTGRVFFSDLGTPPAEALPLTEAVAREITSSLDQLHAAQQRQEIAAREQRIQVARDLHDGVLQALTGVRLELRALANQTPDSPQSLRVQLDSLERAIAIEQRELRFFISGLEPGADRQLGRLSSLAQRLDSVRERLALEWKTPVTLRVSPRLSSLPEQVESAIPLMVHEAAVNALKHARASRVLVDVETEDGHLRVSVSDDGHGFPFRGHYNHASLALSSATPRSLFDRVSALGGQLSIDSSEQGSRVEMVLSL
jgi:signal transduction histidine kinase